MTEEDIFWANKGEDITIIWKAYIIQICCVMRPVIVQTQPCMYNI
jgi:hypothetical protein